MARSPRPLLLLASLVALAPAAGALILPVEVPSVAPLGVPEDLNNVPTVTSPVAVVVAFQDEHWFYNVTANTNLPSVEGPVTHLITVPASPTGSWDRILLTYREYPSHNPQKQDPWDRLCSAAIQGVEVLRCTTPRTDFTLTKDVTVYGNLMPQGSLVNVTANTGTYAGDGQWVDVNLSFYADEPTKLAVPSPAQHVLQAWYSRITCATPSAAVSGTVTFPDAAPGSASVEVTLSGHGNDEFYYLDGNEPVFHVLVDDAEVGQVAVLPYHYAFIGFTGSDYSLHPLMWWTVQQVANEAGVYAGVGEIPAYKITLLPTQLGLLTGTHTVTLRGENGHCYWPSSVTFLLD